MIGETGERISEKVFNILKGFGYSVRSYDERGKIVIDTADATRFAIEEPNILVRVERDGDTVILQTSENLYQHKVRKMLENLCKRYLLDFKYRVFNKKVTGKGETVNIEKNKKKENANESFDYIMEGFSKLHGTVKTSYQTLNDNIRIIVRHKKPIDENIQGSRSRNIHCIFVQQGNQRYRINENSLMMARAISRHLEKGGKIDDTITESINKMGADLRKLKEFLNYVKKSKLINESNMDYIKLAINGVDNIRDTFKKLSGAKTYHNIVVDLLEENSNDNINEENINLESLFTETHFDNKVSQVLDTLQSLSIKKKTFESFLHRIIKKEKFAEIKNLLSENDAIEFTAPGAKLGFHVSQLGIAAEDSRLSNYLQTLSKSINEGNSLTASEYAIIKSCIQSANMYKKEQQKINESESTGFTQNEPYFINFNKDDWNFELDNLYHKYLIDGMEHNASAARAYKEIDNMREQQYLYHSNTFGEYTPSIHESSMEEYAKEDPNFVHWRENIAINPERYTHEQLYDMFMDYSHKEYGDLLNQKMGLLNRFPRSSDEYQNRSKELDSNTDKLFVDRSRYEDKEHAINYAKEDPNFIHWRDNIATNPERYTHEQLYHMFMDHSNKEYGNLLNKTLELLNRFPRDSDQYQNRAEELRNISGKLFLDNKYYRDRYSDRHGVNEVKTHKQTLKNEEREKAKKAKEKEKARRDREREKTRIKKERREKGKAKQMTDDKE